MFRRRAQHKVQAETSEAASPQPSPPALTRTHPELHSSRVLGALLGHKLSLGCAHKRLEHCHRLHTLPDVRLLSKGEVGQGRWVGVARGSGIPIAGTVEAALHYPCHDSMLHSHTASPRDWQQPPQRQGGRTWMGADALTGW